MNTQFLVIISFFIALTSSVTTAFSFEEVSIPKIILVNSSSEKNESQNESAQTQQAERENQTANRSTHNGERSMEDEVRTELE